jgi:quercetin dioxygenase-like cupin family protein
VVGKDNGEALVHVGAFAPDEGEKVGGLTTRFPGSAEIPGDVASGRHSHPDPEVGYIVRGDVAIELDDGATPALRSGDPFLIPPGVIRNARNIGSVTTKDAFHLRAIRGATPRDRLQLKARFRDSGWDRAIPLVCDRKSYNAL